MTSFYIFDVGDCVVSTQGNSWFKTSDDQLLFVAQDDPSIVYKKHKCHVCKCFCEIHSCYTMLSMGGIKYSVSASVASKYFKLL